MKILFYFRRARGIRARPRRRLGPQAIPRAVVAVVDLEKVSSTCNACRPRRRPSRARSTRPKTRNQRSPTPLQSEEQVDPGCARCAATQGSRCGAAGPDQGVPDQAAGGRAGASAPADPNPAQPGLYLAADQRQLGPIYQQVMTRRGANLMVEIGTTLASGATLDVTNDVLAALNAVLPSVQTTAPAQAAPSR